MSKLQAITLSLMLGLTLRTGLIVASEPLVQGYVSQGIIYSGDNPFFDDDTGWNANYRELGLNLTWSLNDKVRFAGQLLSRKAGDLDDGDPRIDFLLMDYQVYASEGFTTGIRLGRVKNQYGIYNTTRDVPHGRPGVFVPPSVYFESLRDALISSDGGNVYFKWNNELADISLDIYGGEAHFENEALEYQLFQVDMPGGFEDPTGGGIHLVVQPKALSDLSLGVTLIEIETEYEDAPSFGLADLPGAVAALTVNPSSFPLYITNLEAEAEMSLYSVQYAPGDWIFSGEYLTIDIELKETEILHAPVPADQFRDSFELNAWYLQAEWLASNKLSMYVRYEELYNNKDDKDGSDYAMTNGGNPVTQYNKAITLGTRWYFTPDLSLTAEYSTNEGAAFINGQAEVDYAALKEDWDLFILQMSFHF